MIRSIIRTSGRWPGVFFLVAALTACDSHVYTAQELDMRPYPLEPVPLDFPQLAGPAQYYGKLRMDVVISADGRVERVDIEQAGVPDALREAATRAFSAVKWEPGRKGHRAVKSVKRVEVDFQPPAMRDGPAPMQREQ